MQDEPRRPRSLEKTGVVVSDRMQKSRVVLVERLVRHPRYRKMVRQRRKFLCHDEGNMTRSGDTVRIRQTRPLSARKRWMVVDIVQKAAGTAGDAS